MSSGRPRRRATIPCCKTAMAGAAAVLLLGLGLAGPTLTAGPSAQCQAAMSQSACEGKADCSVCAGQRSPGPAAAAQRRLLGRGGGGAVRRHGREVPVSRQRPAAAGWNVRHVYTSQLQQLIDSSFAPRASTCKRLERATAR